ncbi:hypothetical protein IKQ21_01370 [bacterium]|nr:hypothetical protein [bacterium]
MFISRNYVAKTGTVIKKVINSEGFLETTVNYGRRTPMYRKGVARLVKTDYGNGEILFDFFSKKGKQIGETLDKSKQNFLDFVKKNILRF